MPLIGRKWRKLEWRETLFKKSKQKRRRTEHFEILRSKITQPRYEFSSHLQNCRLQKGPGILKKMSYIFIFSIKNGRKNV